MNGNIFSLFLISIVLTFRGTEAYSESTCRRQCEPICRIRGDEGLNCCAGTKGGYGPKNLSHLFPDQQTGKYDPVCREGTCGLIYKDLAKYMQSLKILIISILCFLYDALTEDVLYFLRYCKKRYECRDLVDNCDDIPDDNSSEEQASGKL